ncbi:hypothetical protein A0J57_14020 [Sphingobium sp. 22B]|nr:hypothetical protein AXW74_15120 [Sphingobium sp. AM]KYC31735.1 hypothetical protein A0J57_14020 [Sphingobium sp. 22B]OAP31057.1 hypothetical protein A8O16_15405 [Sphingobium sp. 20006FA]
MDLSGCTRLALNETRCRAKIAEVLGKPAAIAMNLQPCLAEHTSDLEFGFVLLDPVDRATWLALAGVPGLLRPLERA